MHPRHRLPALLALGSALLLPLAPAVAQDVFPSRTLRIIVPTVAGGGADVTARAVALKLGERLGQSVIVENRPGGDTLLGTHLVKDAPADGYTLLMQASGMTVFPAIKQNPGYELMKDFTPVGPVLRSPMVMLIGSVQPERNLQEFVARGRKPGTKISFAGGFGTPPHIAAAQFMQQSRLDMIQVPYKGQAAAFPDLMTGRLDVIFDAVSTATAHIQGGKVRPLGVTSTGRLPALPDVPTIAEQGFPNYRYYFWLGLFAPARLPADVLQKLSDALRYAVTTTERFRTDGNEPMVMSPREFADYLQAEQAQMQKLVTDLGIPKQ